MKNADNEWIIVWKECCSQDAAAVRTYKACKGGIMDTWEVFFLPLPCPFSPSSFFLLLLLFFLLLVLFIPPRLSFPSSYAAYCISQAGFELMIPPCFSFSSIEIITGVGKGNFAVGHDTWMVLKCFPLGETLVARRMEWLLFIEQSRHCFGMRLNLAPSDVIFRERASQGTFWLSET